MHPTPGAARILRPRGRRIAAATCVIAGLSAAAGYVAFRSPDPGPAADAGAPREPPRPAGDAELALVAPLAPGAPLEGFEVTAIHAVNAEGVLRIVCKQDKAIVRLDVGLATDGGPPPPAVAGRYAVFYSIRGATPEEGERLAAALANVLKANEAQATPPGMAPYAPPKRPPTPI